MKKTTAIAFFDAKPYDIESFEKVNEKFGFDLHFFEPHLNAKTALLTKGFPVVCAFVNDQITKTVIHALDSHGVKLIALRSAGYNNVDLQTAFKKIHVVRVPAYSPFAVAEHAAALLLTLNRKTHRAYYRGKELNFNINGLLGFDLHGKTVGVIGTGKIGQIFIQIMKGFSCKVLAFDAFPNQELAKNLDFKYVELPELYKKSTVISLHCPLTKETHHLIDEQAIDQMKRGVTLINTSRGGIIDAAALIQGLKDKHIGAAGLDVYEEESEYFFEDFSNSFVADDTLARLLTFPNVLVTSHQGFFTQEALYNIAETTLQNIQDFIEHKFLKNEVCYQCDVKPCAQKLGKNCF